MPTPFTPPFSEVIAMRKALSIVLLILFLSGCSDSLVGEEGGSELNDGEITFVNEADRPFAVVVFEREMSYRVDPVPAYSEEEFEERKIEVGSSNGPDDIPEYERGDDVFVLLYADCNCELDDQLIDFAGQNAKPYVETFTLTAEELEQQDYRVTIDEL